MVIRSYVGMNVRVWYMCCGSVLYMIALEILCGCVANDVAKRYGSNLSILVLW